MPSPGGNTRLNLCHPHPHSTHDGGPAAAAASDLGLPGGPSMCASTPSLGIGSTPTGASCAPADFGRQTLSPAEAEKRNGKRKSDSSGKRRPDVLLEMLFLRYFARPPSDTSLFSLIVARNIVA